MIKVIRRAEVGTTLFFEKYIKKERLFIFLVNFLPVMDRNKHPVKALL
jgi:hypothetical protein